MQTRSFTNKMADDYELALSLQHSIYQSETLSNPDNALLTDTNEFTSLRDEFDKSLDYALALSLQEENDVEIIIPPSDNKKTYDSTPNDEWNPKKIVDSNWELTDPNPNIHDLFVKFDAMFFNNVLVNRGVAVIWSKRMTLCAGLCCYEGKGGLCTIKMSEPLLKLRPRKDLVETLLHEMIHALLFVTANNKDREGHGPEFQKHMHRINAATGANITIYHSFHNEVKLYKQHWWKCDGPCQKKPPFYGMVRRAVNRAPSANDRWWKDHAASCDGKFIKIKEPDGYTDRKSKGKSPAAADANAKGSKNIASVKGTKDISDYMIKQDKEMKQKKRKIINGRIVVCEDNGRPDTAGEPSQSSMVPSQSSVVPSQSSVVPSQSSIVQQSPNYENMRSKMLAAVEKRQQKNTKGKLKRPNTSTQHEPSISSSKKPKTDYYYDDDDDDDDDVLITDPPVLSSDPSPKPTSPLVFVIDEDLPEVVSVTESSTASTTSTCPVCLREDIPRQILTAHVEFCLEEMELDELEIN